MTPCWFVLAVAVLVSGGDASEDTKKELERFRGTWKYVSMEAEGTKVAPEPLAGIKLVLDGDKFTQTDPQATYRGTFSVSVKTRPKTIDVIFTEGPEKGKAFKGIYELEGDTYKVCLAVPDHERPKVFASKPESGHVLSVLKREKP
jgi:uncharacterized protein (TIGR03067 family)